MPHTGFPGDNVGGAVWAAFDGDWYARRYLGSRPVGVGDALDHYLTEGARQGHSPNPFFNEIWYRLRHPEIAAAIAGGKAGSGFEDYCRDPGDRRSPHWLFDAESYLNGKGPPSGHVNAYDHFLKVGDRGWARPSQFFLARTLLGGMPPDEQRQAQRTGVFRHILTHMDFGGPEPRFSPYFDPVWYLRHNPAAAASVLRGKFPSALAHYLLHRGESRADPLEQFSERFYLAQHGDVAAAVEAGIYPCGYAHFLARGIAENRRFHPDPALSDALSALRSPPGAPDRDGMPDGFARLVMSGTPVAALAPPEDEAKGIFLKKAALAARAATVAPLDFTCKGVPLVSVIMVLHDRLDLTLAVLAELQDHMPGRLELILADSGSTDGTVQICRYLRGARLIRFDENVNFVHACNAALAEARGEAVLYMNNDIRLGPRAVERAFRRLVSARDIGAVGGMVVRSHGLLQEAGCIIWRDGFTDGYLRDASPLVPEAGFVRDVDFCSGVFLMVRRDPVRSLGGFDPAFSPAYFEETDLCVRMRQAGWRVVYDPAIRIEHLEYGSAEGAHDAAARMAVNQRIFAARHAAWLQDQPDRDETCLALARLPREVRSRTRILMIEDRLPLRALGSGFVRTNDIAHAMARAGLGVTIYPIHRPDGPLISRRDFPETAEVIDDREAGDLGRFLAGRPGYYQAIWIGRTHNLDRLAPLLTDVKRQGGPAIILDTEAVASVRAEQQAALRGETLDLLAHVRNEFRNIGLVDRVVAVNGAEAGLLRRAGLGDPAVLGHMRVPRTTGPGFDARRGLLFVGAMHRRDSPNLEALTWFVDHALKTVIALLGDDIRLTVIGHIGPEVDLSRFESHPNLRILGEVPDLAPHYDSHRLFVAPTRIAAGIPYKLHEAASEGIPIVATDLLAGQLGWEGGRDLLTASGRDGAGFAAAIARLYANPALWHSLRDAAMARILHEASPGAYIRNIRSILGVEDVPPRPAGQRGTAFDV